MWRAYRTPLALAIVFLALLGVFAITPDPDLQGVIDTLPSAEPTEGPECVVCGIDQECDADSGQCEFIKHTPWPCVPSARFDDEADQCLPEGAPSPPPAATDDGRGRIPGPAFPPGIRDPRGPDLPGIN